MEEPARIEGYRQLLRTKLALATGHVHTYAVARGGFDVLLPWARFSRLCFSDLLHW